MPQKKLSKDARRTENQVKKAEERKEKPDWGSRTGVLLPARGVAEQDVPSNLIFLWKKKRWGTYNCKSPSQKHKDEKEF